MKKEMPNLDNERSKEPKREYRSTTKEREDLIVIKIFKALGYIVLLPIKAIGSILENPQWIILAVAAFYIFSSPNHLGLYNSDNTSIANTQASVCTIDFSNVFFERADTAKYGRISTDYEWIFNGNYAGKFNVNNDSGIEIGAAPGSGITLIARAMNNTCIGAQSYVVPCNTMFHISPKLFCKSEPKYSLFSPELDYTKTKNNLSIKLDNDTQEFELDFNVLQTTGYNFMECRSNEGIVDIDIMDAKQKNAASLFGYELDDDARYRMVFKVSTNVKKIICTSYDRDYLIKGTSVVEGYIDDNLNDLGLENYKFEINIER